MTISFSGSTGLKVPLWMKLNEKDPVLGPRDWSTAHDRVTFNHTGRIKDLERTLPYRQLYRDNPDALAYYDGWVEKLVDRVSVRQLDKSIADVDDALTRRMGFIYKQYDDPLDEPKLWYQLASTLNRFVPERLWLGKTEPVKDPSLSYAAFAPVVELFHRRPDVLEPLLEQPVNLMVCTRKNGEDNDTAGLMIPETRTILVSKDQVQDSTVVHETIHMMSEAEGWARGTLDGMTHEQKQLLNRYRKELGERHEAGEETGFPDGAYVSPEEFLAYTLTEFLFAPKQFLFTFPGEKLYEMYTDFTRLDPLADYMDLEERTMAEKTGQ